jgi:hypothetical protein
MAFMGIENLFRYTALAVGLKPRLCKAKPACAGYTGLFLQRPFQPNHCVTDGTAGAQRRCAPAFHERRQ